MKRKLVIILSTIFLLSTFCFASISTENGMKKAEGGWGSPNYIKATIIKVTHETPNTNYDSLQKSSPTGGKSVNIYVKVEHSEDVTINGVSVDIRESGEQESVLYFV